MPEGSFVAYYRVSTRRQGMSGLGLEAQQQAVRDYLNGGQWKLVGEVVEVESGRRSDRPKLAEALRLCRLHRATLVIAKLDRLARNVAFVATLMESGVEFVAADFPQAKRLTVHILAAVAEHEAKAISERTKAALAAAAARGVTLGGDGANLRRDSVLGREVSLRVRRERAARRAADVGPVIDALRGDGVDTLRAIAAVLNARGIPAPRGGDWAPTQVMRIIRSRGHHDPRSSASAAA
ncbi:recombinase family protein [Methylobacterium sp. 22177]|uniref:recombinase family protein n=1 Tax=Methylobacterium sp. 22177 TaxID=3453885 RepID=UPI003F87EE66